LVYSFSSNSTLAWDISGTLMFNVTSLDNFSLLWDVVISFWVVDNLSLDWKILDSFPDSFDWFIFNDGLFNFLWDVFNLSFNGIIVGDSSFDWDSFSVGHFFVLDDFSFVWDSFDSFDLIVFNVFFFEWDVFDSAFNWDFFSNNLLGKILSDLGVSSGGLVSLVN
jgi:hypothetical protein